MALNTAATRHPTAWVEDGATIADGVQIGPNAIIGADVKLGEGVRVGANVVVTGRTTVGAGTRLFPGVVLGEPPQDFSYKDEPTELEIGAGCTLREHVTMHIGTARGRGRTTVGEGCYFMVGSHVGHDCVVGNGVTLSNNVLLGGHVQLGDNVLIGGGTAVLQRARVGAYAFISGLAGVTRDVVPYAYVTGRVAWIEGLNLVGLKRRGFDRDAIRTIRAAFEILFHGPGVFQDRKAALREAMGTDPQAASILAFIDAAPARPYMQGRRGGLDEVSVDLLESGR
ncbi:acyl-ACP--UDP-N-acetylglucosamine O-acyltransferase [Acuticoccus sp. I52.16.1]|uniref:acyl-ACP--UDP-N-acetylglucosamine O-acyltransferase n=1 Tax=Acuticoccus sp. I52.16.1 TaxID=2928472 RepID=UPI001FD3DAB5|nr:acyl-ACP--UDP-N-acetylglucosamine O-acyltransferase [Acuticoccus sp. I52.16.1]UOM34807.1 acyl-ACP--UDP-N-acetylglucosamine O-acyltransferase [Acuticoccus sp. I52.16.1]